MQMGTLIKSTQSPELEEDDLEIRVNSTPDFSIIQIRSPSIRGTLVLNNDLDREDLTELGEMIHDALIKCLTDGHDPAEKGS